jgi:hypothetical protein
MLTDIQLPHFQNITYGNYCFGSCYVLFQGTIKPFARRGQGKPQKPVRMADFPVKV